MTHNVTQKYDVSIICQDGYGAQDNRNFTFHVLHNEAPGYLNLPKTITLDLRKGSEHDIIFSTMYIDKENENLTYNYHFYEHDSKENVTYFKGDSSGNYYNQLGNISLTTFTYDTPKNTTYRIQICGHERRNEICEILTVELKDYCGPTPECRSATLNVTTELDPYHEIFDVNALVYNATAFTGLEYSLATRHLYLFNIDSLGVITTTATLPASYSYTTYVLNAFVNDINSCSSYSVCPLFLNVKYINYPLTINNLKTIKNPKTAEVHIHEDEDTSLALFTIETEDRNVDDDVICAIINPDDNKPFYMKETFTGSNVFVIKNHVAETDQERKLSAAKLVYHIEISCNDSLGEGDSGELIVNVTENKGPRLKAFIHNGTIQRQVDQSTVFYGTSLFTEQAVDDEGDTLIYTCNVSNSNNPLTCDTSNTILHIRLRRNVSVINEENAVFSIRVCVGDRKHANYECGTLEITFNSTHSYPGIINLPDTIYVPENASVDTVLFTPNVSDVDLPAENHTFTAKFFPLGAASLFALDKSTGLVILKKRLDFESLSTYSILMDVHDNYLSNLVSKKLVINVTDVNEQNYLQATKTTTITFKESKKIGTKFDFGLQCTDEDFYDEQTLTIVGGSYMHFFRLNNTDKVIYLAQEWNLEDNMTSNTIIEVQCEDTGGHRSKVNLNFIIEDVNDNKPEMTVTFSPGWSSNLQINSKTSLSTVFLVVFAYDADIGDSNFVFKVLGNGLGRKYFRLVARESRKRSTGATIAELKLRQPMKLNYHKQFVFHIMVSDGGSPPKFSAFPLSVNYTADDPIPQAAESSNCITCSSKGQLLIGMLATECVIVVVLITHALYAFGLIFKSGYPVVALKIKPLANPRMKVMNIPTNKKFSIQPAPPFKRQSYSNSSSSSSESDDEQVYTRVNETKLYRLSRDPRVESSQFRPSGHYPVVAFPKPVYSSQVEPHFGVVHKHSEMKEFSRTMFNGGPPLTHGSVGTGLPPAFYAGQEKAHLPGTSFK